MFSEFRPFYQLNKPKGRRLVIPDIHGCYATLLDLIQKIKLTKADQLFFLGDFIDRGPLSAAVLDFVFNLHELGFQIHPLRGNHEEMLLDSAKLDARNTLHQYLDFNNTKDLLDTDREINPKYLQFMENLPYYYELEDFYLAHAGFNFNHREPLKAYDDMIWIRDFTPNKHLLKDRKLVHGHTPTSLNIIKEAIRNDDPVIPLDNGCVFYQNVVAIEGYEIGNLLCLDLDTFELYIQPYSE